MRPPLVPPIKPNGKVDAIILSRASRPHWYIPGIYKHQHRRGLRTRLFPISQLLWFDTIKVVDNCLGVSAVFGARCKFSYCASICSQLITASRLISSPACRSSSPLRRAYLHGPAKSPFATSKNVVVLRRLQDGANLPLIDASPRKTLTLCSVESTSSTRGKHPPTKKIDRILLTL